MSDRVIITAGLPYANGSLHLGHLVEYTEADIYVRALKRMGTDALYICADDAHGTPIELNAKRQGRAPEEFVTTIHQEHQRDFARFDIAFDEFGITHSETNRTLVEEIYKTLRSKGHLEDREVDGNWCEQDQRFLPDRFVRGTCPKCQAPDQYGDVCESCGSTYAPTDLLSPQCVLCGKPPTVRRSTHVFFKLGTEQNASFLREWIESGTLQADVANYVRNWLDKGLLDWCISRDGPYFGFAIPDRPGKFFYVWLDAPIGYIASSVEWAKRNGSSIDALWKSDATRIEHIIGKDIVYFHTLFWPAVLKAAGFNLPAGVHVHGMLTVDGTKMSKTRGTFINAKVFADHIDPQALRYYYASKYNASTDDLDLSLDDFISRVNSELVNKHANLFSRASQFLSTKLNGMLSDLPFDADEAQKAPGDDDEMLTLARRVVQSGKKIERHYRQRQFGHVIRELSGIADIGNEFFQSQKPWEQLKVDPEQARITCTFALNICRALAMYLWPIVPRFAEMGAEVLNCSIETMDASTLFRERKRTVGKPQRMFERIERKAIDAIVSASRQDLGEQKASGAKNQKCGKDTENGPQIDFGTFEKTELRVGRILSAERVPKSKKLLRLQVDVGETSPRQIVAGIGHVYEASKLIDQRVVVVVNLKPAKLMGIQSNGMVLAAGEGDTLKVLTVGSEIAPGARVR